MPYKSFLYYGKVLATATFIRDIKFTGSFSFPEFYIKKTPEKNT